MRVLIVGATDEALDLVREFIRNKHEVIVVDDNKTRIDRVVQEFDVAAYLFSLIDLEIFQQIGIHKADIVIAIHSVDTVNIVVCTLAKHFRVPKVYAIVNNKETADILEKLELANSVKIKSKAVFKELLEMIYNVRITEFDKDHYLILVNVEENERLLDKKVNDIEDEGIKVLAIVSSENNIVSFDKNYSFKKNDKVFLIADKDKLGSFLSKFT